MFSNIATHIKHQTVTWINYEFWLQVCEYLGISNESDYFGLKYESSKGEELWLNLRNPIDRQVSCHGHTSPLRLALRVKFWVPPHLLLQETTRWVERKYIIPEQLGRFSFAMILWFIGVGGCAGRIALFTYRYLWQYFI